MRTFIVSVVCVVWMALSAPFEMSAKAAMIQRQGFSRAAIVETFEGISPSPGGFAWRVPTPYTLPSGATLTTSYPNGTDSFGPCVVDDSGFFGYAYLQPYIPSGKAYLGQANAGLFDDGIVFTLPRGMHRVGAYVVADPWQSAGGPVHVTTYDALGNVLDSTLFSRAAVTQWRNHFVGFENATEICSIRFRGEGDAVLRLDNLTFEPVPEPSTFALLSMGAMGLLGWIRRSRRIF